MISSAGRPSPMRARHFARRLESRLSSIPICSPARRPFGAEQSEARRYHVRIGISDVRRFVNVKYDHFFRRTGVRGWRPHLRPRGTATRNRWVRESVGSSSLFRSLPGQELVASTVYGCNRRSREQSRWVTSALSFGSRPFCFSGIARWRFSRAWQTLRIGPPVAQPFGLVHVLPDLG
jgi:hypothetical protein